MNQKRLSYVPPQATDLSALSVSGQGPLGACKSGNVPFYSCVAGPTYVSTCTAGTGVDDSSCSVGGYHQTPSCNFGASAATICMSGVAQQ